MLVKKVLVKEVLKLYVLTDSKFQGGIDQGLGSKQLSYNFAGCLSSQPSSACLCRMLVRSVLQLHDLTG